MKKNTLEIIIICFLTALIMCGCSFAGRDISVDTQNTSSADNTDDAGTTDNNNLTTSTVLSESTNAADNTPTTIAGQNDEEYSDKATDTHITPSPSPTPTPIPKARLMFTGDLMCLGGQIVAAATGSSFDFNSSFKYVKSYFDEADLVLGNLETCVTDAIRYTAVKTDPEAPTYCNAPESYLDALKTAGFDVLATANNHTCDALAEGIDDTIEHIKERDFDWVGTSTTEEHAHRGYILREVNGIRFAVLSYTQLINRRSSMTADELSTIINAYNDETAEEDIKSALDDGADFVIVFMHWGQEHTTVLTSSQTQAADWLAECGADLIIGSHSHCLQPCEYIETSDGRQVLCMYSMGNYVSSMARAESNHSLILDVTVTIDANNHATMLPPNFITGKVIHSYEGGHHVICPTDPEYNGGKTGKDLTTVDTTMREILGVE